MVRGLLLVFLLILISPDSAQAQAFKWSFTAEASIRSTPTVDYDGTIYFGSDDDYLYALNPDKSLRWRFKTGGDIRSSPAVAPDGTVYVGSDDNKLYAVNREGQFKWAFTNTESISSSPTISADGTIYFGSGDNLYALRPDGSERWQFVTSDSVTSSPSIGPDGTIYFGSDDSNLYAIDPDGVEQWRFSASRNISSAPAISVDGTIYIGGEDSIVYAINPDGSEQWRYTAASNFRASPSIGPDGTIYINAADEDLYALQSDGTLKWRVPRGGFQFLESSPVIAADGTIYTSDIDKKIYATHPDGSAKWQYEAVDEIRAGIALGPDGTLYFGSNDDRLYAISSAGAEKWQYRNHMPLGVVIGNFNSSPAVANDGTVYVGSSDHKLYAFNPNGTQRWTFLTGADIESSPAIGADGTIYIGSNDGSLYAINPDGTQRWAFAAERAIRSSPAIATDGTIYVGSADDHVYAIDSNGQLKWKFLTGDGVDSSPAIGADGTIYVGSEDTYLYTLQSNGTLKWKFKTGHEIHSSPAIGDDGTIYIGSRDDYLYAIRPDGTQKWRFLAGDSIESSPEIAADGTIYVGSSDEYLYAINPDGSERWRFRAGSAVSSSPTIGPDGTIYVGSDNLLFFAVNPAGKEMWFFSGLGEFYATPALASDGTIYIGNNRGYFYALYPPTDAGNWPMFKHNPRHTGLDIRLAPVVSGERITNIPRPTWTWQSPGAGSGQFRYVLNSEFTDSVIAPIGAVTTFTPQQDLTDDGYIFSVQECLDYIAASSSCLSWSNPGGFATQVDTVAPRTTAQVSTQSGTSNRYDITLTCSDTQDPDTQGSGCDAVYYVLNGTTEQLYSGALTIALQDILTFYAIDRAGNREASRTINDNAKIFTTLNLDFISTPTLLQNDPLTVSGQLTLPQGDSGIDLSNLLIELVIAPPGTLLEKCAITANLCRTETTATLDNFGRFEFTFGKPSGFTEKGAYSIQARFNGTALLVSDSSASRSVLVGTSAGYAILIQGKIVDEAGIESHQKTADRIYRTLLERGFAEENIYYFGYGSHATVDAIPSRQAIQKTIEDWAADRMNGVVAPLHLIMVDHGSQNAFHIDQQALTPEDLNQWLNTLQTKLTPAAQAEPQVVIIGACYSGSFIPALSKPGRIIMTSATAEEESYKGALEEDGIRVGEFFLEELFHSLRTGQTYKQAFVEATEKTEQYTRRDSSNSLNQYFDNAVQHPLLDDNGDGTGSNVLSDDGEIAEQYQLGVGTLSATNNLPNTATISQIPLTLYLDNNETSAVLQIQIQNNWRSGTPWLEVRKPSKRLNPTGTSTVQLDNQLRRYLLDSDQRDEINTAIWRAEVDFNEAGLYEIFYFTRDSRNGTVAPMQRSLVYRNRPANLNNPPSAFNLLLPTDGATVGTIGIFDWQDAIDPDGVSYIFTIASDPTMQTIVHQREGLISSFAAVGAGAGLQDLTTYYWQVTAVDSFGARTHSVIWRFFTDDTNLGGGLITGLIRSDHNASLQYLQGVQISVSDNVGIFETEHNTLITNGNGKYAVYLKNPGLATVMATKPDYCDSVREVYVRLREVIENFNFELIKCDDPIMSNGFE